MCHVFFNLQLYYSYFSDNAFKEGYTLYPILMRPHSRGKIRLRSASPVIQPQIEANYLSDYRDVLVLIEGVNWDISCVITLYINKVFHFSLLI